MDSRPKHKLCVDNSVLEERDNFIDILLSFLKHSISIIPLSQSVQTLTFSSRIKVTTLTHLDDLQVEDECECQEVLPPPPKCKPMHLVFLIDGSDGYNEKTRNKHGYTEGETCL